MQKSLGVWKKSDIWNWWSLTVPLIMCVHLISPLFTLPTPCPRWRHNYSPVPYSWHGLHKKEQLTCLAITMGLLVASALHLYKKKLCKISPHSQVEIIRLVPTFFPCIPYNISRCLTHDMDYIERTVDLVGNHDGSSCCFSLNLYQKQTVQE